MPYQNLSQMRAFHAKLGRGEIKKSTVDEFDQASKGLKLPKGPSPHANESKGLLNRIYRKVTNAGL